MQAITLWQPWATLIALGLKKIETRSWPAPVGGPAQQTTLSPGVWIWRRHGLAIHAAQRTPGDELRAAFRNPWIRKALADYGITEGNWTGQAGSLPQGAIVAVVTLTACAPTDRAGDTYQLTPLEQACGNYRPGRWAWLLADRVNLNDHPVAVRGRQRIWTLPLHTQAVVQETARLLGHPLANAAGG